MYIICFFAIKIFNIQNDYWVSKKLAKTNKKNVIQFNESIEFCF